MFIEIPASFRQAGIVPALIVIGGALLSLLAFSSSEPVVVVASIVIALCLVALFLARPVWLCGAVLIAYSAIQSSAQELSGASIAGVTVNGAQLFGTLATAVLATRLVMQLSLERRRKRIPRFALPCLLLVASMSWGTILSPQMSHAIPGFFRFLSALTIFLFVYSTTHDFRSLRQYFIAVILSSVVVATAAVYETILGQGAEAVLRAGAFRAEGSIGTSSTGTICFVGVAVGVYFFESTSGARRWISLLAIAVLSLGLFSSFVRASILATGLFLVLRMFAARASMERGRSRSRRLAVAILVTASLSVGLLVVDEAALDARLQDVPLIGAAEGFDPSAGSGRFRIWASIITASGQNSVLDWIVGNGVYSTKSATLEILYGSFTAHNTYLTALYDQGLLGLLAYALFLFVILRDLLDTSRSSSAAAEPAQIVLHLLVSFAVMVDMFQTTIYSLADRSFLYVVVACVLGLAHSESRLKSAREDTRDLSTSPPV